MYISHVAIYLGNGWMIQAPEPGLDVEVVPADFGSEFAGADPGQSRPRPPPSPPPGLNAPGDNRPRPGGRVDRPHCAA